MSKRAKSKTDIDDIAESHRTPEYQSDRAEQLLIDAGEQLKLHERRQKKVDWSVAPGWAAFYRVRDDGANVTAAWTNGVDMHETAIGYFDVGIGEVVTINKADCDLIVFGEQSKQEFGQRPQTGVPQNYYGDDIRPGANPVAANVNGYRKLSDLELQAVNAIKACERDVSDLFLDTASLDNIDQRWLAIAKTDLQKGFMALVRAVAKPENAF